MNKLLLFCLFISLIVSCKKEHEKVDYDSLITYKSRFVMGCNCDTGKVDFGFYIPSAFTPDHDGINEYWEPKSCGLDSSEYHLSIFDKTGTIIFDITSPGKFYGTGKDGHTLPMQTFGYDIDAKDKNGEYYNFKGKFILFR